VWGEIRESVRQANLATDGTYAMEQEYLLAIGVRNG